MLKKLLFTLTASALLVLSIHGINASAAGNENWMRNIAGNRQISDLSIPGTHDSGAAHEPVANIAKCQDLSIDGQLRSGVRYLDIRCREIGDSFTIHHGPVYQKLNFDDVLNSCKQFLRQNPTETIVMSVKEEYNPSNNTKSFQQVFEGYVNKDRNLWYLENRVPNLDSVRGKIVLLRRFGSNRNLGINALNWQDNTTFQSNNGVPLYIQDCYKVSKNDNKWAVIRDTLERAKAKRDNYLYLNYCSGYKPYLGIPNIGHVSSDIKNRLNNYFNTNTHGRYGVVVMDFADEEICSKIIRTN